MTHKIDDNSVLRDKLKKIAILLILYFVKIFKKLMFKLKHVMCFAPWVHSPQ